MQPEQYVDLYARELRDVSTKHCQPWLSSLLQVAPFKERLITAMEDPPSAHDLAAKVTLTRDLKPGRGHRDLCLNPVETELAIMQESRHLVARIEAERRPASLAEKVDFRPEGYWLQRSWRQVKSTTYKAYLRRIDCINSIGPVVVSTDIRNYFASLNWSNVILGLSGSLKIDEGDVASSLACYREVWRQLPRHVRGMPIGPAMSGVIGAFLLTALDDFIGSEVGYECMARWMDDVCFRVRTREIGESLLTAATGGPLADLGLQFHADKTRIHDAVNTISVDSSYVPLETADSKPLRSVSNLGELITQMKGDRSRELDRDQGRDFLATLRRQLVDPEREAELLVCCAPGLMRNEREVQSRLMELCGGVIPTSISNDLLRSYSRIPPGSPADGRIATALLRLAVSLESVGRSGKKTLHALVGDTNRDERTRVAAAWLLADVCSDFHAPVLRQIDEMSLSVARGFAACARLSGASLSATHAKVAGLARFHEASHPPARTGWRAYLGARRLPPMYPPQTSLELADLVEFAINTYNKHVMHGKGWQDIRDDKGELVREPKIGDFFSLCTKVIFEERDVHAEREAIAGLGRVDFMFSRGVGCTVLLELKRLDHPHLLDGLYEQLPAYLWSLDANVGYLLVMRGSEGADWDEVEREVRDNAPLASTETGLDLRVRIIDARPQIVPSRRRRKVRLPSAAKLL